MSLLVVLTPHSPQIYASSLCCVLMCLVREPLFPKVLLHSRHLMGFLDVISRFSGSYSLSLDLLFGGDSRSWEGVMIRIVGL